MGRRRPGPRRSTDATGDGHAGRGGRAGRSSVRAEGRGGRHRRRRGDGAGGTATTQASGGETTAPATTAAGETTVAGQTTVAGETTVPGDTTASSEPVPETGPFEPGPNDTAGVTDTEIVIGIHAPVTGASPIPQESFDVGKDIYWKFLADSAPTGCSGATCASCSATTSSTRSGPCRSAGRWSSRRGPSCSSAAAAPTRSRPAPSTPTRTASRTCRPASTRAGSTDLATYFTTTLTYAEQAPLIIAQLQEQGFTEAALVVVRHAVVRRCYEAALKAAAEDGGIGTAVRRTASTRTPRRPRRRPWPSSSRTPAPRPSSCSARQSSTSSAWRQSAANQSYTPVWIGPGITSGLNAVAAIGCPDVATGEFFSPTPASTSSTSLDPDFNPAYPQFAGGTAADDIGLQLWSLNKAIAPHVRGDRRGARPGGVHEHARHRRRRSTTGSTRRCSTPSTTTSAAPAPTCCRPTATSSSTSPPASSSRRADDGRRPRASASGLVRRRRRRRRARRAAHRHGRGGRRSSSA